MRIYKLRKWIPFYKRFSITSNVCLMRKELMNYLDEEGVANKVHSGMVHFVFLNINYLAIFEPMDDYAKCTIRYAVSDERYEKLTDLQKMTIGNVGNTTEENSATIRTLDKGIQIDSYFYFSNNQMMLQLFETHFEDITSKVADTAELTLDCIAEQAEKRPIGFSINKKETEEKEEIATVAKKDDTAIK